MKNLLKIIDALGGLDRLTHFRLSAPGFMDLVVERVGTGPEGLPLISVAHYFEQNGDLCPDPEMTFEVAAGKCFPVSFQTFPFPERVAAYRGDDGKSYVNGRERADQASFARIWDRNLKAQGFLAAALARAT